MAIIQESLHIMISDLDIDLIYVLELPDQTQHHVRSVQSTGHDDGITRADSSEDLPL